VIEVPPDVRLSMVVGHATGLIARECDCGPIEAFDRLQDRASALNQSLEHTALDVLDGLLRFAR
jgi:hypothetical protein